MTGVDPKILNMLGDVPLPPDCFMMSSCVLLIQYIDDDGRECRGVISRAEDKGIRTWQLIGLLELAKAEIILENLEGLDQ